MRSRLFTLLSAPSLLLFIVIALLWPVSYIASFSTAATYVSTDTPSQLSWRGLGLHTNCGTLDLRLQHLNVVAPYRAQYPAYGTGWICGTNVREAEYPPRFDRKLGFHYNFGSKSTGLNAGSSYAISAPHWFLLILFGLLPARRLDLHRRHRHAPGLCPTCGYDLRASKDRCPEGGTPIAAKDKPDATADARR